ncbi:carboxypeptidase-like regulatory domain-containing protein [Christiangramia portivictoriae]|uniref:carboxypeptidase-like regulatory domain-containing protein n=1 Tax=Christiangramia portivictoriae TaxID=326069 RepID=UPI0004296303|nr:carboxypeptidase-like regulatory domain-containing protein [Christiangramia portivictoriae]
MPVLLCFGLQSFAQEFKMIKGSILAGTQPLSGVHVINKNSGTGTTSDDSGNFKVLIRQGDILLFTSVQFEKIEVVVSEEHLRTGTIEVIVTDANRLEEVEVGQIPLSGYLDNDLNHIEYLDRDQFHIPHPEKKLTPNELRLYTANEGVTSRWSYIGILLGGVSLDVLLNDINGRTKYLREMVELDRLQVKVQAAIDLFGKDFFNEYLDLHGDEIINFIYYSFEDEHFSLMYEQEKELEMIEYFQKHIIEFRRMRTQHE